MSLPAREQPANRAHYLGLNSLSAAELIACLLHVPNAHIVAINMLEHFGSLAAVLNANQAELTAVRGIGPKQALRVQAALELGNRLATERADRKRLFSPQDVGNYLIPLIAHKEQEHFLVLLLDGNNNIIKTTTLYIGQVNQVNIRAAEVFREAIRANAVAIIIAHNHPSGNSLPSPEDVALTNKIRVLGETLELELMDSFIITPDRATSLKQRGLGGL